MVDNPNQYYGGSRRAHALRNSRSPPRNNPSRSSAAQNYRSGDSSNGNGRNVSPMRSNLAQRSQGHPSSQGLNEEELYELRRQQELRRQIEVKERELETLSQNKDRLNRRQLLETENAQYLGQSNVPSSTKHFANPKFGRGSDKGSPLRESHLTGGARRSKNSPLHHNPSGKVQFGRSGSTSKPSGVNEYDSKSRDRTPPVRLMPVSQQQQARHRPPVPQPDTAYNSRKRSPESPLRQKSLSRSRSPKRDIDMREASHGLMTGLAQRALINPVRTASSEYLSQLQHDNSSLQRRLNLVLQELDRVNRERGALVQKMNLQEQEIGQMQAKLNNEDDADKLNSHMQMDVNGHRDTNAGIKRSIQDTDMARTDAIAKLRALQADRDRRAQMADELKNDLHKKMAVCKQLEQEQYAAHTQIQQLEEQLSLLKRQDLTDNTQIDEVRAIADKLTAERDDLQTKLEHLNRTYDNCVGEITRERAQMEGHNRHHNKLIVAKVTFSLLEHMFKARKQEAMNEFFQYCKFDQKCHSTLKQFVKVVERLGQFRIKVALTQWHQKTFKPIETFVQHEQLAMDFERQKLLSKMFNRWRKRQLDSLNCYQYKNKALLAIWNAKVKDVQKDVQRAFTIWRDRLMFAKFRHQRCKKLVWRAYSNRLARAWQVWLNYSQNLDRQVRLHILARTFAEDQLKRVALARFRFTTTQMRRIRLMKLRAYYKAWREHNQYKRFILSANVAALGFKKDCNRSLLKACFDALRQSKEEEKHLLMVEALEGDCQPAIEALSKSVETKTNVAVRQSKSRGCNAVKDILNRRIAEYFNKWKDAQQRKQTKINDNLKAMIIRRWQSQLRDAFDLWKKGRGHKDKVEQTMIITEMTEQGNEMSQEMDTLNKKIEVEKKKVDRSGRSSLDRGTRIMKKRFLKQCMDRWAESHRALTKKEDGSQQIVDKMRKKFLRNAFDLYRAGCKGRQLEERNEGSCEQLRKALDSRLKRKCFEGIKRYVSKHRTSKRYWTILLGKMDHWMKKRAFGIWMQQGNEMKVQFLQEEQNQLTEEMTVNNNKLGVLTKKAADKSGRNAELNNNLKRMGQKSLSNTFARAFYKRTARAFELWKEYKRADSHKNDLIKRMLYHWRTKNTKHLLAVMENWKAQCRIRDQNAEIARIEYEMGDMGIVQTGETSELSKQRAQLKDDITRTNKEFDTKVEQRSRLIALMANKNEENHFTGRLRYIFAQWRAFAKRQRHFSNCVRNVITKSIWQKGFQNIREYARDKQLTRGQNKSLVKLRNMFWRRNCGRALSKWRQTEYEQALEMISITEEQTNQIQEEHAQVKRKIQKQNCDRSSRIVRKDLKHKYYHAWRNVARWLKHKRVSTQSLSQAQGAYAIKRLIKKWKARTDLTVASRAAFEKMQQRRAYIYKRAIYNALMLKHHREKQLALRLSNMARKYDNKNLESAFRMIMNFSRSKADVHGKQKDIAARNIAGALAKIYRQKLLEYYQHLRMKSFGAKQVEMKKRAMFAHFISASVRDAFNRWKKKAGMRQTVIEANEIGPVVEEVLDKQLDVTNLKNLMADEGFSSHQIADVAARARAKGMNLLAKSIGRWKCAGPGTDDYLKPKMFDRWRQFVQMRRIVKHWLGFMENRQKHQKADLSHSFNKWKHFFSDKQWALQKRTRAQLLKRGVNAAKRLEVLADSTQQDEDLINHLSDQNDELFNNYKKGQKLSFVLGKNNLQQSMMKGLARMAEYSDAKKKAQLEAVLQRNIDLIAATKDKIREVENDNEALANENEELRQFSLDGYQLGKNVQTLTAEREKLSVDLADKANTIKKLLDENERLSRRLRQAQESAATLMRTSQANMAAMTRV